jgi:hypothetical protein
MLGVVADDEDMGLFAIWVSNVGGASYGVVRLDVL